MNDRKTVLRFFTIPEWQKEQDFLRKQHKNGWKFTGVSSIGFYHFDKCEPEDVVYQLDYNPNGTAHKGEYIQMFHDCGWKYIQDYAGYSYFCKPVSEMNGEEEIFCENASRLDMMKRVFQGRVIPLIFFFFLLILPNIYLQAHFNRLINQILLILFMGLFLLYLALFAWFGYQFWRYWKSLQ